jgi:hypothetical protein
MIEGSGSISLTNGSLYGYGRSRKIWILRIRIRNNGLNHASSWIITIREGCFSHPFQLGGSVRVVGIIDGEGRAQLQNLPQHQVHRQVIVDARTHHLHTQFSSGCLYR